MSALSGNITYTRLRMVRQVDWRSSPFAVAESMAERAFRPIDPVSDIEQMSGWVRFDNPLSVTFGPDDFNDPAEMQVAIRVDVLRINKGLLDAHVNDACAEQCRSQGRDKLSRRERDTIKLEVKRRLRRKALPAMHHVQAVVDLIGGQVRLFTSAGPKIALFIEHFERTFGLQLAVIGPVYLAQLAGHEDIDGLGVLDPTRFHLFPAQ